MTAALVPQTSDIALFVAGERLVPLYEGGLWWPDQRTLVVSDLHLEKGSAYARAGQMLPPYDTRATLAVIAGLCARLGPERVISLGDSFHDGGAEQRLAADDIETIRTLTGNTDWIWVEGNHDPDPPASLGGRAAKVLALGRLVFRHEPTGAAGEVSGHLHPAARVRGRARRAVRRPCFVTDGDRLVMPALGAFTGGLNVCDPAVSTLFPTGMMVFALGDEQVHPIPTRRLIPDTNRQASQWRSQATSRD